MKLKFNVERNQPDPFIFKDGEIFYLYCTAKDGVETYSSKDIFGEWQFEGMVATQEGFHNYWAPSVIKIEDTYYMYVSCQNDEIFQHMFVASADSPLGPFRNWKKLFNDFSIDSHIVQNKSGLYLFYSQDNANEEFRGTRIFVDKLINNYELEGNPKEIVSPSMQGERNYSKNNWFTIEGAFYFYENGYHYLMYSGGDYKDDTYHIGYAVAKGTENDDLRKLNYIKHTDNGKFAPLIIKNSYEEGTGHNSVIKINGEYYAIYHGRDYTEKKSQYSEARTARICKLTVKDGIIIAQR